MNENLRRLMVQADYPAPEIAKRAQELAELIVRECCNVLQGEDILHGGYGYNQGFLHKKIKEHFGVEE
jgi:hypothetical protein